MEYCLVSKTSDCRNCYKCIRHCPIKAISFKDNKAEIIHDECILCGRCHLVCPQNLKIIRNDIDIVKELIIRKQVVVSLAPSFISYFHTSFDNVKEALLKLGFYDVEETAIGATIVKKQYEKMMEEEKEDVIISSCCHSVNLLIQKHYKEALKYLAPVYSPMVSHGKDIKERNEKAAVVFVGPCIAKKDEGDKHSEYIDAVLTFEELEEMLTKVGIEIAKNYDNVKKEESKARLFPITGGILKTLNQQNPKYTYLAIDGVEECEAVLEDILAGKIHHCFIEMSACHGSCVNGPLMREKRSIVSKDIEVCASAGEKDFAVNEKTDINYEYSPIYFTQVAEPTDKDIQDILNSIGKSNKENELNCGSCGYETCRKKARAVLLKRATREMCLPYLMEKAQSFSNNIVSQSNVGYLVLDENLNIQLVNRKLCQTFGIYSQEDILKSSVSTILDPTDFAKALGGDNLIRKKEYLSSYDKYIEMTITYDKKYHILIASINDITSDELEKQKRAENAQKTLKIANEVIEKNMRSVQEIASLLGESAAETKVALLSLKETIDKDE